jgi:hypothetical protein
MYSGRVYPGPASDFNLGLWSGRYYPGPASDFNLGDATTDSTSQALLATLHGIAVAINQAKLNGDTETVQNLLVNFQQVADAYRAAGGDSNQLTAFDQFILDTGNWVAQTVGALPGAISAVPSAIGKGLIGAALPFVLLYVGYLFLSGPKFRGKF